jgi:hypothetical protein
MKRFQTAAAAAVSAFFVSSALAAGVPGQGTWETTLLPRDINGDSVVDAYYDTVLDISWLVDAHASGRLSVADAIAWATALDVHGVAGWRLPETINAVSSNANAPDGAPASSSEMAHLYYATLGNLYIQASPANTGPFSFLGVPDNHWSSTPAINGFYWFFRMTDGQQGAAFGPFNYYGWAVHDGDVAPPPIPEPATWLLTSLGVLALAARRARRQPATKG